MRLAESGNFSRVAEAELVTQSAVSQQISRLERTLGVQLFHRTTHQTTLTDEGLVLLPGARDIVGQSTLFERTAHSLARELSGRLRIGSPFHGAQCSERQAVLARLAQQHPRVDVAIHNSWTSELIALLRSSSLDLTFVNFSLVDLHPPADLSDLDFQLVIDAPCDFLVPSDHPAGDVGRASAGLDLAGATVLMYPRDLNPWLHDQRRAAIERVGAGQRELREPSLPGIIADVSAGRGIFPAIPWELPPDGTADGVSVVRVGPTPFRANLWAVRRRQDSNRLTDWIFDDVVGSQP